ncbi:uncharacterized protein LOC107274079 [Cephus cinctus]|uniref:Uncharacterized protein LOC107274079 n=1 Tax=Cephus cinctus TaxID=211228 RepID=A0AAJ7FU25_CEPCN|nr:uncharacterized protein LOC107274079 [Cephus cinctus]
MDNRPNNSCSTPITGNIVKDYSLPLSRIDSNSSDNKSNSQILILNRKRKRCRVNNNVRYKSVRFHDSDTDTEDNWVTDWEESLDSHSKNADTSHDKKTSESTDDSIKLKDSPKTILKKPTIIRNSRYSSTEETSKVHGISTKVKKYTSPELIRDAVHVENLFLEKFDQPLAGTSNHHSQKYTPRIDVPIHSKEEGERCKGDEILPVDKVPLQLPSALHYSSSDDEFPPLSEFMKRGDWKTYEKRPAIRNKRKEIPSKNKTIIQTEITNWIYPKHWLSTANRLWNKFKKFYSSTSSDDSSVTGNGSWTHKNSFNDISADTSECLNTSSQNENYSVPHRQKKRVKRFGSKRKSVNENIDPAVNRKIVYEPTKPQEDNMKNNEIFIIKHISDRSNKMRMSATKKILKRNYKRAIPITDDDDSCLEFEIKKPEIKIRKANLKIENDNDKYLRDSKVSDGEHPINHLPEETKILKWQCVEVEEDGPWRYDGKDIKVRMELQPLENISVESQGDVEKKVQPVVSVSSDNKKPRITSVEKISTKFILVSGQSRRLIGSKNNKCE